MKFFPRRWMPAALLMLLVLPAVAAAQAGGATLDKIVATVDDEIILLSEVAQDVQLFLMQTGARVDSAQHHSLLQEALENMVKEKVLLAKARRDGIEIEQAELDNAMDRHLAGLIQQAGGQANFDRQLLAEGLTQRDLRRELSVPMKEQLMVQRVVERETWELTVSDEEARAFFDENRENPEIIPLRPQAVKLAHILVVPKAEGERADSARAQWQASLDRLDAGEEFAEVAREMSGGPAASAGGDLGWFELEDIAQLPLRESLVSLPPGESLREVITDQGIHIVRMEERVGSRVHFRQILIPLEVGDEDRRRGRDRAKEAWKFLEAGGDWAEAVGRWSDDEFSRNEAGGLPLIPEGQLDDRYREVIELLEAGEFSTVFRGLRGFQIIRLTEREPSRPFAYEEIEEQLGTELLNQKRNETLEAFLVALEEEVLVNRIGILGPSEMGR